MSSQKTSWDLDIRIRERNLQKGILSPKDIERHLKDLPDVAANAEAVSLTQPVFDGLSQDEASDETAREGGE